MYPSFVSPLLKYSPNHYGAATLQPRYYKCLADSKSVIDTNFKVFDLTRSGNQTLYLPDRRRTINSLGGGYIEENAIGIYLNPRIFTPSNPGISRRSSTNLKNIKFKMSGLPKMETLRTSSSHLVKLYDEAL